MKPISSTLRVLALAAAMAPALALAQITPPQPPEILGQ
jgi:D-alanyl-D-alanine carboxypeptidase (penicillin-binding protein 5/6)